VPLDADNPRGGDAGGTSFRAWRHCRRGRTSLAHPHLQLNPGFM